MRPFLFSLAFLLFARVVCAKDWTVGVSVPKEGRANVFNLSSEKLKNYVEQGQIHAQIYPVSVTGILLPEKPLKDLLDNTNSFNPIRIFMNEVFKNFVEVTSFKELFEWLGLLEYPKSTDPKKFQIALPNGTRPDHLLGYSRTQYKGETAFTMSCATCHSGKLFGQTVFGMSKRFPKANQFFLRGHRALGAYNSFLFQQYTGASDVEAEMLERSVENLKSVGVKNPVVLGLDTSLAQVALSLNMRADNEWADKSERYQNNPRPDFLDSNPGDSKPAVWWNLKYKNRWLSDGSVVSGNPVYTNILWNEIGRGADLRELSGWLDENEATVDELTTAVFANEAPHITDFFPASRILERRALKGEAVYNQACSKCHGIYTKNWSQPEFDEAPWSERVKTYKVEYFEKTFVVDVGTDPYRYLSMKSLEQLNKLNISKKNGIKVKAQTGYVPPPLVGIWARWPYMHNNSIPNLCSLLTPSKKRSQVYYAGAPIDKKRDFDFDCNGYPLFNETPKAWKKPEFLYDSSKKGLSNSGHDEGIFTKDGESLLSDDDIHNLIQFLQTL